MQSGFIRWLCLHSCLKLARPQLFRDFAQRDKLDVFRVRQLADKPLQTIPIPHVFRVIGNYHWELRQTGFSGTPAHRQKHLAHQRIIQAAGIGNEILALQRGLDQFFVNAIEAARL